MQRTVFFISDSTGITAETIGNSILAQFEGVQFDKHRLPFTDNAHKAEVAALRIKTNYAQSGQRPIVVNTMADRAHRGNQRCVDAGRFRTLHRATGG